MNSVGRLNSVFFAINFPSYDKHISDKLKLCPVVLLTTSGAPPFFVLLLFSGLFGIFCFTCLIILEKFFGCFQFFLVIGNQ